MTSLFADIFAPASRQDWLRQVQKDLKDPNGYEGLRWQTPEGFVLEPYYTAEDVSPQTVSAIQAAQKQLPGWLNTPEITPSADIPAASQQAREALDKGADAILFTLPAFTPLSAASVSRLLQGIKLSDTPVYFRALTPAFLPALRQIAPYQLKGGLLIDPVAVYLQTGEIPAAATARALTEASLLTSDSPQFRTICASSHVFHNAGANATQELAFLLSSLADTCDLLTEAGLSIGQVFEKTVLSVSVGTSYFSGIARLRALRVLWQRFVSAYGMAAPPAFIHVQTSTFYDAAVTPYTNLLRATTEAMSAVMGGADLLTVHPYDTVYQAPDAFSERIARNVSVLLKEEAHLDKVADPSAGAYYIEQATDALVQSAWALFMATEQQGGLLAGVANGYIQEQLQASYDARVAELNEGKIMVGVNKFRYDEGALPAPPPPAFPNALIPDRRLAAAFEK
ncbi:methylmalonyl-CoA mutase family protein [Arsenicibacter rosenii]|uniref:Methylmalonyl-CoA mutase n=1 Tax=Arsenicibacter rosenii TaxID=1750698 RepID=A0A1S2VD16_9BACT|nr:methylmalonyl-CoA mutase family protein [Arsenicibacter rosenii]OIN56582.1 methylmalonyl-CoA mutase [Arsenicibacter rosenii]